MNDWLCGLQYDQIDPRHLLGYGGFMDWADGKPVDASPTISSAVYIESLAERGGGREPEPIWLRHQRYTSAATRPSIPRAACSTPMPTPSTSRTGIVRVWLADSTPHRRMAICARLRSACLVGPGDLSGRRGGLGDRCRERRRGEFSDPLTLPARQPSNELAKGGRERYSTTRLLPRTAVRSLNHFTPGLTPVPQSRRSDFHEREPFHYRDRARRSLMGVRAGHRQLRARRRRHQRSPAPAFRFRFGLDRQAHRHPGIAVTRCRTRPPAIFATRRLPAVSRTPASRATSTWSSWRTFTPAHVVSLDGLSGAGSPKN